MKHEKLTPEELRANVLAEIKASEIGKIKPGETPIILCRNSRTAVKRAKSEFKESNK